MWSRGSVVVVAAWLLVGCSSSSASPSDSGAAVEDGSTATGTPAGDGSTATGTPTMGSDAGSCAYSPAVWKEDGTTHCASSGEAILSTNTTLNDFDGGPVVETSLEVLLLQPTTSYDVGFIVTSSEGLGGSYTCVPSPASAQFTYDEIGVFGTSTTSCSISVTLAPVDGGAPDGGMVATGTFSAVLAVTDGGTKTISDGTFAFAVTSE